MRGQIQEKEKLLFTGVKQDEPLIEFDEGSPQRGESTLAGTGKESRKSKKNAKDRDNSANATINSNNAANTH